MVGENKLADACIPWYPAGEHACEVSPAANLPGASLAQTTKYCVPWGCA